MLADTIELPSHMLDDYLEDLPVAHPLRTYCEGYRNALARSRGADTYLHCGHILAPIQECSEHGSINSVYSRSRRSSSLGEVLVRKFQSETEHSEDS